MNPFTCFFALFLIGYLHSDGKLIQLLCGRDFKLYNPVFEECIDNQVYKRTSPHVTNQTTTSTSSLNPTQTPPHRVLRRICRSNADLLRCNTNVYCGRTEGYRCCGFEVYHPKSQTCCQKTSAEYKIHDSKPEKQHICCNLDLFDRGSPNVTCNHASSNDKFLLQPSRLKGDTRICNKFNYVFRIDIKRQLRGQYLIAGVYMWIWRPVFRHRNLRMKKSTALKKEMDIKLDKYSRLEKNIARKSFLMFSSYNYLQDSVLFLRSNEVLYKSPKTHKSMVRKLRNNYAKCTI